MINASHLLVWIRKRYMAFQLSLPNLIDTIATRNPLTATLYHWTKINFTHSTYLCKINVARQVTHLCPKIWNMTVWNTPHNLDITQNQNVDSNYLELFNSKKYRLRAHIMINLYGHSWKVFFTLWLAMNVHGTQPIPTQPHTNQKL